MTEFTAHDMRIHTLDLAFQNLTGVIAAYVIETSAGLLLIETGPGSSLASLREGLRSLGLDEKQVRHVFVTHVHLDHAGAAGWWAQQGARVYCHKLAARHLIDPSKLLESARQIYAERMDTLWGEMLPAPESQVTVLADGESVSVGEVTVTAWDTPGHARHHHAYLIDDVCFTGDVAGMRLQGTDYISVTAAPPQFDPAAYVASINRLAAANFSKLYLTHFGEICDVAAHLSAYRQRIVKVHEAVKQDHEAGLSADQIRLNYRQREHELAIASGLTTPDWLRLEQTNSTAMCADGVHLHVVKSGAA